MLNVGLAAAAAAGRSLLPEAAVEYEMMELVKCAATLFQMVALSVWSSSK